MGSSLAVWVAAASFSLLIGYPGVSRVAFALDNHDELKILASNGVDRLGFGVGTAIGSRIAVVGSLGSGQPYGPGAVHVFLDVTPAGTWCYLLERMITASDGADQDYFGFNIALTDQTIAVSAHGLNDSSGAVYIFRDTSLTGDWSTVSETKIVPSGIAVEDNFGISLDIENRVLVVGAYFDDDNGDNSGSVFLFRDTSASGDWSVYEETKINPSDAASGDRFGSAVDLQGLFLLIGSSGVGKAYLMSNTSEGSDWSSISESIIDPSGSGMGFGITASLSGSVAAVGDSGSRAVHVFVDTSVDGSWGSFDSIEITPFDRTTYAEGFGYTMALSDVFLVVGAYQDEEMATQAGAVYVYEDTSPALDWSSYSEIKTASSDVEEFDRFGRGLASLEESWIAGAANDDDAGENNGAAYIYSYNGELDVNILAIDPGSCPMIQATVSVLDSDGLSVLGLGSGDFLLGEDDTVQSIAVTPEGDNYRVSWDSSYFDGSDHYVGLIVSVGEEFGKTHEAYSQSGTACDLIFADGFESGDTTIWSSTVP